MNTINTAGSTVDEQHLDAIQRVPEFWGNPDELNLEENVPKYFRLYEKGIGLDALTLKILKKWDEDAGTNDFGVEQIQKARSYAHAIMEHYKQFTEVKFEDMTMNEKVAAFSTLSEDQRKAFMNQVVAGYANLSEPLKGQNLEEIVANLHQLTAEGAQKTSKIQDLEQTKKSQEDLVKELSKRLEEEGENKTKAEEAHNAAMTEKEREAQKAKADLAEERRGRIVVDANLTYDPTPIKPYKSSVIQKDKLKEGYAIKFLSRQGRRNRKKLNRLIENINEIGQNPDKGVRYIFSMTKFASGGKLRASFKKRLLERKTKKGGTFNAKDFGEFFATQRKAFVEDVGGLLEFEKDKKRFDQIKNRVDRWIKAYAEGQANEWKNITRK